MFHKICSIRVCCLLVVLVSLTQFASVAEAQVLPTSGALTDGDPDYGSVALGNSRTDGLADGLGLYFFCPDFGQHGCVPASVENVYIEGSADFAIVQNGCEGYSVGETAPGDLSAPCEVKVKFAPSSLGPKQAQLVFVTSGTNDGGFSVPLSGKGVPVGTRTALPPLDTRYSCPVQGASSINMDSLALQEEIPLTGIPFSLYYSSDRFRSDSAFAPKSLGLGGWTPEIVHHYNVEKAIFYGGDNEIRNIQAASTSDGYYVTDTAGTEIYYFDSNGIHQKTKDALTGVTKYLFSYDAGGRLAAVTDRFGNTTSIQYSAGSATVTSPYGQVTTFIYDSNGFLASVANPKNEVYQLTSNDKGLLLSFAKPMGQISQFTYDDDGFLVKDLGAGGNFIQLTHFYDSDTGLQTVTSTTAMNYVDTYLTSGSSSDASRTMTAHNGNHSQSVTQNQGTNTFTDPYGNIYQATQGQDARFAWMAPYDQTSTYTVPNSGISQSIQTNRSAVLSNGSDPLSLVSLQEQTRLQNDPNRTFIKTYSAADRLMTLTSPLNRVVYQRLNDKGLMSQLQVGGLQPTGFAYDAHGNLASMVQGSRQTQFTYDNHGNLATSTDPMGRVTKYTYDDANRVIEQMSSLGNVIRMTYDKNGNVTSILPPGRPAHQFFYNLFELVQSYLPPALTSQITGATTYTYNLDKQITEIHRPDGRVLTFGYLPRGVLWYISGDGGVDIGTELSSDRVTDISSRDERLDYTYAGNTILSVTSSKAITSKINYGYNADGSLASISMDGGLTENFGYDRDGLVTQAADLSLQRDNVGNINATTLGKVSETVKFNEFGEIAEDRFIANQKKLFGLQFTRNAVGQITSIARSGVDSAVQAYEYNSEGRLTKAYNNNILARTYTYDANGNRLSMTDKNGTMNATYNDQDQLIKYGNIKYNYAANGERSTKTVNGKQTTYGYNACDLRPIFSTT